MRVTRSRAAAKKESPPKKTTRASSSSKAAVGKKNTRKKKAAAATAAATPNRSLRSSTTAAPAKPARVTRGSAKQAPAKKAPTTRSGKKRKRQEIDDDADAVDGAAAVAAAAMEAVSSMANAAGQRDDDSVRAPLSKRQKVEPHDVADAGLDDDTKPRNFVESGSAEERAASPRDEEDGKPADVQVGASVEESKSSALPRVEEVAETRRAGEESATAVSERAAAPSKPETLEANKDAVMTITDPDNEREAPRAAEESTAAAVALPTVASSKPDALKTKKDVAMTTTDAHPDTGAVEDCVNSAPGPSPEMQQEASAGLEEGEIHVSSEALPVKRESTAGTTKRSSDAACDDSVDATAMASTTAEASRKAVKETPVEGASDDAALHSSSNKPLAYHQARKIRIRRCTGSVKRGRRHMLSSGQTLDRRYQVRELVGQGRGSEIYRAFDRKLKKDVALKVEKEAESDRAASVKEAQIIKYLNRRGNEDVVKLHDVLEFDEAGIFMLVEDLLAEDVSALRKRQAKGYFSLHDTARVGIAMLRSLRAFHEAGLVHRDLKPSNFAVPIEAESPYLDRIFLIDFGLARYYLSRDGSVLPPRKTPAPFRGTTLYASLSTHNLRELGRRDDLWSFLWILVDFSLGDLPWRAIRDNRPEAAALKRKLYGEPDMLLGAERPVPGTLDPELQAMVRHIQALKFEDCPDYDYLMQCLERMRDTHREQLDWRPDAPRPAASDTPLAADERQRRYSVSQSNVAGTGVAPSGRSGLAVPDVIPKHHFVYLVEMSSMEQRAMALGPDNILATAISKLCEVRIDPALDGSPSLLCSGPSPVGVQCSRCLLQDFAALQEEEGSGKGIGEMGNLSSAVTRQGMMLALLQERKRGPIELDRGLHIFFFKRYGPAVPSLRLYLTPRLEEGGNSALRVDMSLAAAAVASSGAPTY